MLLAELIEAAARSGQPERATGPLAQLAEITHAAGTDRALGAHARLSHIKTRATLARAHLLYGEWLGISSRKKLRAALSDVGAAAVRL